ncbi:MULTISPECIES: hypothetical protein [unclassified Symbiopectobacterium]|uniref:hypothetical protein n=1 Tax=unclassified Symbiopectobacterium TaxID=2794573 RepID=UPI0022266F47|nr:MULTISPECIES: hypothetical protein [unclassified Symbiopectobacterium]MCW2475548.1 hypothetical protein [Candidatus Symbiopectobacterium sp. NZEC151]MCW2482341.1 hypothetical protein [Candidatus Symbiopectobacterium sp. NZEC135]
MTTAFNISGNLFSRTISLNEIEGIKNAKNPNEIKSLWGKIADWFCGTDKENAKKALFELINNDDATIKIDAFNQLKAMVSPAFKDAFTYTTTAISDTSFTVNLSIGALFSTGEISTTGKSINLNEHIKTFTPEYFIERDIHLEQVKKDIPRSEMYFCHTSTHHERITVDMLPQIINKMSEEQKKSLNIALSQIGVIDIKNQINQHAKAMSLLGDPSKKLFLSLKNQGNITVEIHIINNLDAEKHQVYQSMCPESKYPCLYAKARIDIDINGHCNISDITVSHPGIE